MIIPLFFDFLPFLWVVDAKLVANRPHLLCTLFGFCPRFDGPAGLPPFVPVSPTGIFQLSNKTHFPFDGYVKENLFSFYMWDDRAFHRKEFQH
jgi:hypothetical protein